MRHFFFPPILNYITSIPIISPTWILPILKTSVCNVWNCHLDYYFLCCYDSGFYSISNFQKSEDCKIWWSSLCWKITQTSWFTCNQRIKSLAYQTQSKTVELIPYVVPLKTSWTLTQLSFSEIWLTDKHFRIITYLVKKRFWSILTHLWLFAPYWFKTVKFIRLEW